MDFEGDWKDYKDDKDKKDKDKLDKKDKYDKLDKKDKANDPKMDKDLKDKDKDKDPKGLKEKKEKDKAKDKEKGKDKLKSKLKEKKEKEKHLKGEKGPKGKDKVIKGGDKKRRKRIKQQSWTHYIHKVLKTVHEEDCTLSSKAMGILDSFANDLFERISTEAVKLLRLNNKRTLTSLEIQTASKLVLPGELCKHAIQDGAKAVSKYQLAGE